VDCHYINLDRATERRRAIENNFNTHRGAGWTLSRFAAIDQAYVRANAVPGALHPAEKACFLSHSRLIASQLGAARPFLIMEDDAVIGRRTCRLIDGFLSTQTAPTWDILFTNISVAQLSAMTQLVTLCNRLAETRSVSLVDLKGVFFHGAVSYILNPASLGRIHAALDEAPSLDLAFDNRLRELIQAGTLRGFAFVPFLTALSDLNLRSQIRSIEPGSVNLVWHAFSRLLWVDRAEQDIREMREAVLAHWSADRAPVIDPLLETIAAGKIEYE
jgi:hypothetical protein